VHVQNIAGTIDVAPGSSHEVRVEARVEGGSEAERARMVPEVTAEGDEVNARVRCGGEGEWRHDCPGDVRVRFTVVVPPQSHVRLNAVSAAIAVRDLVGPLDIHGVSGEIDLRGTSGELELHVVSGAARLTPRALARTEIHAVSGDVTLAMPAGADAELHYSTVSGRWNSEHLHLDRRNARWGQGRVAISVSTVSGGFSVSPLPKG
jgi:hypothetical protein